MYKINWLFFLMLFIFSMNSYAQKSDPVIITVNDQHITKSDFLRAYLKNNDNPKYDKESLDEYLDLYIKFKLKVAEAEALGYDTLPDLIKELNSHKEQLSHPYLIDTAKSNELINEAYERMQSEVKASHILVSVKPDASPSDTLKAYNKALELKKRIDNGEDFADVAAESDDPSAKTNKGDLGYFTAFQMVYPFETAAYTTPVGEVSMPIRSNYGYHIIKVTDKRKARGTITTAHIMIVSKATDDRSEIEKAEQKINEIYEKLQNGEPFDRLARLYSDDQGSKSRGGRLMPFGSGTNQRMVTEFEDAAFALKNNGDYSEPFRTDFGYHIVQRIDFKPLGTLKELEPQIKQKITQGDRSKISEKTFISRLKEENPYKDKSDKRLQWFYDNIDSTIYAKNWSAPNLKKDSWLFKYNKQKYNASDFLNYLANKRHKKETSIKVLIDNEYNQWKNEIIINDEKSQLENKYPQYKALLQEYHDGILLYEIMKDKVWDKAIKDTTGLQNFFNDNISKYQWPDRIDAIIFSSENKEKIIEAELLSKIDTLSTKDIVNKINADSQLNIKVEEGKFIQDQHSALKGRDFDLGKNEVFLSEDKYYLVIVNENVPAGPKQLHETRGVVIQDYQEFLESNWLKEIEEKHTVTVNKDVLYSIGD